MKQDISYHGISAGTDKLMSDADEFQIRKIEAQLDASEWNEKLDKLLQESILRNTFNFDSIAVELTVEAAKQGLRSQSATQIVYSAAKCRLRWSYIHLLVSRST